jgi:hypothetical protein
MQLQRLSVLARSALAMARPAGRPVGHSLPPTSFSGKPGARAPARHGRCRAPDGKGGESWPRGQPDKGAESSALRYAPPYEAARRGARLPVAIARCHA